MILVGAGSVEAMASEEGKGSEPGAFEDDEDQVNETDIKKVVLFFDWALGSLLFTGMHRQSCVNTQTHTFTYLRTHIHTHARAHALTHIRASTHRRVNS